jgi:hypothetical protein
MFMKKNHIFIEEKDRVDVFSGKPFYIDEDDKSDDSDEDDVICLDYTLES